MASASSLPKNNKGLFLDRSCRIHLSSPVGIINSISSSVCEDSPKRPQLCTDLRHRIDGESQSIGSPVYFLLKEHPSVNLALPPVGWQSTWEQPAQTTTDCAWEKTVVMVKQPGHLTSMKNERGAGTRVWYRSVDSSSVELGAGHEP